MAEEIKVAILEQKLEDLKDIIIKIDDAIEKMSEVNSNVSRMLAVHEQRITKQEEVDNLLFSKIDKLRDKVDRDYDALITRIQSIEKRVWMAIGAIACITFLTNNTRIIEILTPEPQTSILVMDFVDVKYINLISARFQKFKKIKNNLYNFRCPICGDSQKNKSKARGYLYQVKNNTNFKCHNCGVNISFNNFLKQIDSVIYKQYTFEKFKDGKTGKNFTADEPVFKFEAPKFKPKLDLPKASLNPDAKKYLESRKLNPDKFYYTDQFKSWTNSLKDVFDDTTKDEPRVIIPLFYQNTLIGFQGRSLGPSKIKYITVMLNDDAPKIYGLDEIEKNKTVYITEGPFDSTFISNAIALCGADGDVSKWGIVDCVWIYDNEPRNAEIHSRISRVIDRGEKVVIWPSFLREKDINDMILSGLNVQDMIESNTYSGLEAKLKFTTWKKI
jgi:transcription elongation factor Elf1